MATKSVFNTDVFKATLTGGGARPNQFAVALSFPAFVVAAATTTAAIAATASQFLVTATSLPGASIGKTGTMYRGREIKLAGDRSFEPWRCTVINDSEMNIRHALEVWSNGINGLIDNSGYLSPFDYQVDATLSHLDRNNNVLRSYTMVQIMPVDIGEIQLNFGANDQVEEYDVIFEIQSFYINDAVDGYSGQATY